jgi:hypothetical protein
MRVVILRILYSLIQFAELYFLINFIHYFRENFTELLSAVRIGKNNLPLLTFISFDFSTLDTTIPHEKFKTRLKEIHNAFYSKKMAGNVTRL